MPSKSHKTGLPRFPLGDARQCPGDELCDSKACRVGGSVFTIQGWFSGFAPSWQFACPPTPTPTPHSHRPTQLRPPTPTRTCPHLHPPPLAHTYSQRHLPTPTHTHTYPPPPAPTHARPCMPTRPHSPLPIRAVRGERRSKFLGALRRTAGQLPLARREPHCDGRAWRRRSQRRRRGCPGRRPHRSRQWVHRHRQQIVGGVVEQRQSRVDNLAVLHRLVLERHRPPEAYRPGAQSDARSHVTRRDWPPSARPAFRQRRSCSRVVLHRSSCSCRTHPPIHPTSLASWMLNLILSGLPEQADLGTKHVLFRFPGAMLALCERRAAKQASASRQKLRVMGMPGCVRQGSPRMRCLGLGMCTLLTLQRCTGVATSNWYMLLGPTDKCFGNRCFFSEEAKSSPKHISVLDLAARHVVGARGRREHAAGPSAACLQRTQIFQKVEHHCKVHVFLQACSFTAGGVGGPEGGASSTPRRRPPPGYPVASCARGR